MYSGEEGMEGSFNLNQVDISGTGKSEDSSEEEDEDDTGEVKEFTYHSDASFGAAGTNNVLEKKSRKKDTFVSFIANRHRV